MPRYLLDLRTANRRFPGVGRYAFNLARAMIACLRADEGLDLIRDPRAASDWELGALCGPNAALVDLPMSPFSVRQDHAVADLARRHRSDLYHSPHYATAFPGRVPAVVTVHDLIPLLYPGLVSLQARVHFRLTLGRVRRRATHIIASSRRTRCDLVTRLDAVPQRITTIPLAADPAFRPLDATTVARHRARLGLEDGYVLYVGSNKPHKNLLPLMEAWAAVQPRPVPLVVAGPWDRRYPQARTRCAELGLGNAVRFIGNVPELGMPALYAGALLLVLPSRYEGFGLPALEAMACGTPVACADAGSLPEVVGEAALAFDPGDVGAIATAIARVLDEPSLRTELARQGCERTRRFSWRRAAAATVGVYRETLG